MELERAGLDGNNGRSAERTAANSTNRSRNGSDLPLRQPTEKQQDTLMRLIVQYHNGSRLWCLRGWKPNELADMHGNSGVPSISFGPGLQQAFADGTMDKGDLIRKIQELGWKVME